MKMSVEKKKKIEKSERSRNNGGCGAALDTIRVLRRACPKTRVRLRDYRRRNNGRRGRVRSTKTYGP